jgi:hypothetical protein
MVPNYFSDDEIQELLSERRVDGLTCGATRKAAGGEAPPVVR